MKPSCRRRHRVQLGERGLRITGEPSTARHTEEPGEYRGKSCSTFSGHDYRDGLVVVEDVMSCGEGDKVR
jgi:hypothetical protein